MFGLKRIDDTSIKYNVVKQIISGASTLGGMAAFDAVVIPFVDAVWSKHRVIKTLAYFGAYNFSLMAGLLAKGASESFVDIYKDAYNLMLADHEDAEFQYEPSESDEMVVNDVVAQCGLLEFNSLEEAQKVADRMRARVAMFGTCTIQDLIYIRDIKLSDDFAAFYNECPLIVWGWDEEELGRDSQISIDKISDNHYILNLTNYKSLADKVYFYAPTNNSNKEA